MVIVRVVLVLELDRIVKVVVIMDVIFIFGGVVVLIFIRLSDINFREVLINKFFFKLFNINLINVFMIKGCLKFIFFSSLEFKMYMILIRFKVID